MFSELALKPVYDLHDDPATKVRVPVTSFELVVIDSPGHTWPARVNVDVGPTTETEPVEGFSTWTSIESKPPATLPVSAVIGVPPAPPEIEKLVVPTIVDPRSSTSWPEVDGPGIDVGLSSR